MKYEVSVIYTGSVSCGVEADSRSEALVKAVQEAVKNIPQEIRDQVDLRPYFVSG